MPRNVSELLSTMLPKESVEHLNNARRELLLALRSWLDANIVELEGEMKKQKSKLKKVEVR